MVIGQSITFAQETILNELIAESNNQKNTTNHIQQETPNPAKNLRSVILRADLEKRLVIGLHAAIKQLSEQPSDTLFCVLITPKKSDSATHMQEVLLKAFCFENDIYILQVDSAVKLGRLLNLPVCDSCVLVQRSQSLVNSAAEESLIDFCEEYWDAPTQPVLQLPEP